MTKWAKRKMTRPTAIEGSFQKHNFQKKKSVILIRNYFYKRTFISNRDIANLALQCLYFLIYGTSKSSTRRLACLMQPYVLVISHKYLKLYQLGAVVLPRLQISFSIVITSSISTALFNRHISLKVLFDTRSKVACVHN